MQVVNQLLDPRTSEFTAAFVGRLVSTLISRAGTELGEQLDQILRAILSKMQQAETLSVMQVKPMFCSLISIWMIQLTDTDLSPLLLPPPSLWSWCLPTWFTPSWSLFWSSCAVFPGQQGNLPWSLSWLSGWADSTCFTDSTRAKSGQVAYLFLKCKICSISSDFDPYRALCHAARWLSVSCCSIASTQMTNVSRILLWREKRYTALTMASERVLNLSRVSHQNTFRRTCIFYKLPIIWQWHQGWPTVLTLNCFFSLQTLKDGLIFLC